MSSSSEEQQPWQRTHTCGELRAANIGETVRLNGWVHSRRNLGSLYFIDLRDRYGLTQLLLDGEMTDAVKLSAEDVILVEGKVVARDGNINKDRVTGEIEIQVSRLEILSKSATPPMEVAGGDLPAVETRLRYRYLDLRREPMQKNLMHRARMISSIRRAFDELGFLDIETPVLTKATPEGARDYLVPSRVHPGSFYALPQSPQIFKQILMVSGFDRYYQVARCFRDEDLRADRQPDFTQLDMEMSFVEEEDVYAIWEQVMQRAFKETLDVTLDLPFPRMTYAESMERYGSDKPDVRFGLELVDVADWAQRSTFKVFHGALESGGRVKGINIPGGASLSRKQIDALGTYVGEFGAKGLAWWKAGSEGGSGPLARFCEGDLAADLMRTMGASEGDLCVFVAASSKITHRALGELRVKLGRDMELMEEAWRFLWVTDFPMFEYDEEAGRYFSTHHPFTAPADWDLNGATSPEDPRLEGMLSRAYDLVLNGWELGSGSIRIHRQDVQDRVFGLLGIDEEERQSKFGFLLEALSYGAPPHGGFAMGLDRITALTAGLDNIRDIIAFPKTTAAADLMCEAPSLVSPEQLADVHIQLSGRALDTKVSDTDAPPIGDA